MTSYLGNFCVDTLTPVEEYKFIEKRTGMSYAKKTYSLGKAVKLEEFTTGNDYYKTAIGYEKEGYISTEKALVRFGDDLFIKGIVQNNISVTRKKPLLDDGKYALIDIAFVVTEVDPYDADTVAQQGSFRGLTRTFQNGIYK